MHGQHYDLEERTFEFARDVRAFVKKHPMPWTHWYASPQGGVVDDWEIESLPTIFVLDAKGIIRARDVREKELDAAVDRLLREEKDEKK